MPQYVTYLSFVIESFPMAEISNRGHLVKWEPRLVLSSLLTRCALMSYDFDRDLLDKLEHLDKWELRDKLELRY